MKILSKKEVSKCKAYPLHRAKKLINYLTWVQRKAWYVDEQIQFYNSILLMLFYYCSHQGMRFKNTTPLIHIPVLHLELGCELYCLLLTKNILQPWSLFLLSHPFMNLHIYLPPVKVACKNRFNQIWLFLPKSFMGTAIIVIPLKIWQHPFLVSI